MNRCKHGGPPHHEGICGCDHDDQGNYLRGEVVPDQFGRPPITTHAFDPTRGGIACGGQQAGGMICGAPRSLHVATRVFDAIDTPDVEVTVTMRVPMSESTYRKLKAAASLRGVGQGQLAAQIIEEQLGGYMNFGPGGESFPFERPSA